MLMQTDPRFTINQRNRLENERARRAAREESLEFLPPAPGQVKPCGFLKRVRFDEIITPTGQRVLIERTG